VKTVASVLGHSGLAHVDKYLRVIDERKKQAVNRLPEINIIENDNDKEIKNYLFKTEDQMSLNSVLL